jgi:hypothetical protein
MEVNSWKGSGFLSISFILILIHCYCTSVDASDCTFSCSGFRSICKDPSPLGLVLMVDFPVWGFPNACYQSIEQAIRDLY